MIKKIGTVPAPDPGRQLEILNRLIILENEAIEFDEEADGWEKVESFGNASDARTEADNRSFDIILLLPSAEEEGMRTEMFPLVEALFQKYIR